MVTTVKALLLIVAITFALLVPLALVVKAQTPPTVLNGQYIFAGSVFPPGQARGIEILTDVSVEAGGAGIGLRVAPILRAPDGLPVTSLNAFEIDATFLGNPSLLPYLGALSVVNPKSGPAAAAETYTVRIDGAPWFGERPWALIVANSDGRYGGGAVMFEGNNRHHIGAGNTDPATQLTFRTTADPYSRRGVWLDNNIQGIGPGDMGVILLVEGTLKEPPSGTARGAGIRIDPPKIVPDGGEFSDLATFYILGAPTAGANNYALWVDDGLSRFDGEIILVSGGRTIFLTQVLDDYERRLSALEARP